MDNLYTFQPLEFSGYVALHWLLVLITAGWLVVIYRTRRAAFVKPSMLVLAYYHLIFQWPAALNATEYERLLPDPYSLLLCVHGFVLVGLAVSAHTHLRAAEEVWTRLTGAGELDGVVLRRAAWLLAGLIGVVVAVYLTLVPFSSTGLYAILMNPLMAAIAREQSLKLLENRVLAYAYSFAVAAAAPLLAVLLGQLIVRNIRRRAVLRAAAGLLLFVGLLGAVSLSGARSHPVMLLVVLLLAFVLRKGLPFRPVRVVLAVGVVLMPAVLITVWRESQVIGLDVMIDYFVHSVLARAFAVPLKVGAWYLYYAQTHGPLGIAAIPRLANLVGVPAVNAPNMIGLLYAPYSSVMISISANAGFVLTYFSYFGVLSLAISLSGLWLTDIVLVAYRRLSRELLLPCVAAGSLSALAFVSSDYTVVWVTHGFGIIPLLAYGVDRMVHRFRGGVAPWTGAVPTTSDGVV